MSDIQDKVDEVKNALAKIYEKQQELEEARNSLEIDPSEIEDEVVEAVQNVIRNFSFSVNCDDDLKIGLKELKKVYFDLLQKVTDLAVLVDQEQDATKDTTQLQYLEARIRTLEEEKLALVNEREQLRHLVIAFRFNEIEKLEVMTQAGKYLGEKGLL